MVSRREREKEERRKYILDKAQTLFAQKGYMGTSMAEIAGASEFAVGSLYSFFKSKEEILATIFEEHIEKVIAEVKQTHDDKKLSPREKIESCLESLVRIYVDNQDFFRIYIAEARDVEWGVRTEVGEYIYKGNQRFQKILGDVFREAMKDGVADRGLDPEFLALLLRSFVHTTVSHFLYGSRDVELDELLRVARQMLFHGIQPLEAAKKASLFPDSDA
jgi:AcrR family transcriptional regulator